MFPKVKTRTRQEREILLRLDPLKLPNHVAIIMDGNGRWAKKRGLPRVAGHREGINSLRDIIEVSAELDLGHLTVYAFSAENWQRPKSEVSYLMGLIEEFIVKELDRLNRNNVRFRVLGRMFELSDSVQSMLQGAIEKTARNDGLNFNVALNYGGRVEILDAFVSIGQKILDKEMSLSDLSEDIISDHLYSAGQPDPDFLIRTSGEFRISNFLPWQLAYSEIFVTPVFWPDFRRKNFFEAVENYQGRERRFGKVLTQE